MLSTFASDNYQLLLSLYVFIGILGVTLIGKELLLKVPALKRTYDQNQEAAKERNSRSYYPAVQKKSMIFGLLTQLAIFVFILPFCLTLESQSLGEILLDIFVILMVYDFFYYLVHRYVFHDGPLGGPLIWVHAVHHQAKEPCRLDSNYLNPIETCMGLALYGSCIGILGLIMGDFHVITIIITWIAFSEINQHNHDIMDTPYFPFTYLNYMSKMHHVHHSRFTSGNYATITLFYDWLFGTLDNGDGYQKVAVAAGPQETPVEAQRDTGTNKPTEEMPSREDEMVES